MVHKTVHLTRDEARDLYDEIPNKIREENYQRMQLGVVKLVLVQDENTGQHKVGWLKNAGNAYGLGVKLSDLYTKEGDIYTKKLIGVSVDYIYQTANLEIGRYNQAMERRQSERTHPKKQVNQNPYHEHNQTIKQVINKWRPDDWDREEFQEPLVESIDGYMGSKGIKGGKAGKFIGVREIAKEVRKDLKQVVKSGYLPQGLKFSVTSDTYSGGSSIRVTIKGLGDDKDIYTKGVRPSKLNPKYQVIQDRVKEILQAYNHDTSNSQVDYFSKLFYSFVEIESEYYAVDDQRRKLEQKLLKARKGLNQPEHDEGYKKLYKEFRDACERLAYIEAGRDIERELPNLSGDELNRRVKDQSKNYYQKYIDRYHDKY